MRETVRLSLRLMLFALVAALALAITNEITKGPIAEQAIQKANATREQVLPGADAYEEMQIQNPGQYPGLGALHRAVRDGETIGYTFLVTVSGYKGPIVMTLAVNTQGSVNALAINSQAETAGLGSKISEAPFLSQFTGVAADPDSVEREVDAISGATVSSRAALSGVSEALMYARDELGIEGRAGEVVTAENADGGAGA